MKPILITDDCNNVASMLLNTDPLSSHFKTIGTVANVELHPS
jgi:hypothetical protein